MLITLSYSCVLPNAIFTPVFEKQQNLRHFLRISNTSSFAYWVSNMIFEIAIAIVLIALTLVIVSVL